MQRLRTLVPGHLSSHSALSSYGLFAPLALWRFSGAGTGEFPGFWGSMVSRHAPIPLPRPGPLPRKGSSNNNLDHFVTFIKHPLPPPPLLLIYSHLYLFGCGVCFNTTNVELSCYGFEPVRCNSTFKHKVNRFLLSGGNFCF